MQNRIFLTFACPLKWDDLADINGEVSRRQCQKCQCSVQKVDEDSIQQFKAMRATEPGKRHCVAIEDFRPVLSILELVKSHFVSSLSAPSRETKQSIAIAFSAYILLGGFYMAPLVEAKGEFSKDLKTYQLDKKYKGPVIGQGHQTEQINVDAYNIIRRIRVNRMQPMNANVWKSEQANNLIDDFDSGVLSKAHVFEFANFLKDRGQFLMASRLYQLYLNFDPNFKSPIKDADLIREAFTDKPALPSLPTNPPPNNK